MQLKLIPMVCGIVKCQQREAKVAGEDECPHSARAKKLSVSLGEEKLSVAVVASEGIAAD